MNKDDVQKLAKLARIDVPDGEAESLSHEFESILKYVSEIKGAAGVTSAGSAAPNATRPSDFPLRNVLRDDYNPHESVIYTDAILKQAPSSEKGYIKVKKIL
jgi:aspartyl/glutamyl-tRNA(Asn/Gln) amidotransferase C subunit